MCSNNVEVEKIAWFTLCTLVNKYIVNWRWVIIPCQHSFVSINGRHLDEIFWFIHLAKWSLVVVAVAHMTYQTKNGFTVLPTIAGTMPQPCYCCYWWHVLMLKIAKISGGVLVIWLNDPVSQGDTKGDQNKHPGQMIFLLPASMNCRWAIFIPFRLMRIYHEFSSI